METTTLKIGAIGSKADYDWLKEDNVVSNLQYYSVAMLHTIPSSNRCFGGVMIVGENAEIQFSDLANLIRQGYSLFLQNLFSLREEEYSRLLELATEAGVYIVPSLPGGIQFTSADRFKPLSANVEVGLPPSNKPNSWLNHCINSIAIAVGLVPYGVKKTRFVEGDGFRQQSRFFGCQLEFENSSLVSVNVSLNGSSPVLMVRVVGQSGNHHYTKDASGEAASPQLFSSSTLSQFKQVMNGIVLGEATTLTLEQQQAKQILHIYRDLEARLTFA